MSISQTAIGVKDHPNSSHIAIDIRAGHGGREAARFTALVCSMYVNYAHLHGWTTEFLFVSLGEHGGLNEVSLEVTGEGAFARLQYETGIHRLQRVPPDDQPGRPHTSSASVMVQIVPEEEELALPKNSVEMTLEDQDSCADRVTVRLVHTAT